MLIVGVLSLDARICIAGAAVSGAAALLAALFSLR
jgi:hypothetical protein